MFLSWQTILAIGLGGFLGSIARAYAVHFTNKYIPLEFPLGILLVNLIGSFIIGILFAYFSHYTVSVNTKAFLTTGFLGALTTYSTFAIETYLLFGTSIYLAITNIFFNLVGTILAAGSGYRLVQYFIR
ncbi:fluoride efflux transporter CrcB [Arcobacter cloacae]|uniref:Fluoride-specific ion channel FluC n=1 Tax=Arcobacter cloacae TaxID=1054034 RepID=A0A6M8N9S7_9BACT|nr:fluoride efflux transporter CrcB [Arcobacter cloacae]NCB10042.1 fluoride efflux transporter CrcB [Erysipelotrichia bacterium]QKF90873.1 putative fluoride ion transporter [Arcobacter cloacae]RXI43124.1 fluoride efflux transporter CrcB [Arcobacter cloacae]